MKDLTGKCPVMHGAATTGITGTTNSDWWPNQLNLNILRQHDRKSNPLGDDFDYRDEFLKLDYKSCEMISDDLFVAIAKRYPGRKIEIDVSEDGENGSHAVYERNTN